ncbi:hypothetical protein DFP72DRAFT_1079599 [Ephemerocybe angulata]|uniref:Uncharacterized protein n=1 Tax=Ephemerocybe angulata TaxID=980116 RepID=A0A8H6LV30_9AGAR|nr:hypothetical protein DFP72DRAFT_1079599 [Tulosesus angulatus]
MLGAVGTWDDAKKALYFGYNPWELGSIERSRNDIRRLAHPRTRPSNTQHPAMMGEFEIDDSEVGLGPGTPRPTPGHAASLPTLLLRPLLSQLSLRIPLPRVLHELHTLPRSPSSASPRPPTGRGGAHSHATHGVEAPALSAACASSKRRRAPCVSASPCIPGVKPECDVERLCTSRRAPCPDFPPKSAHAVASSLPPDGRWSESGWNESELTNIDGERSFAAHGVTFRRRVADDQQRAQNGFGGMVSAVGCGRLCAPDRVEEASLRP